MPHIPPWRRDDFDAHAASEDGRHESMAAHAAVEEHLPLLEALHGTITGGLTPKEAAMASLSGGIGAVLGGGLAGHALAAVALHGPGLVELGETVRAAMSAADVSSRPANVINVLGRAISLDIPRALDLATALTVTDVFDGPGLDAIDVLSTGVTAALTAWLARRQGWEDPLRFHQAFFVAHGTEFLVSLPVNANPIAAARAIRQGVLVVRSDEVLLDSLDHTWRMALQEGEQRWHDLSDRFRRERPSEA